MAAPSPAIVWFRRDLRLADNPALLAALEAGGPLLPLFILEDNADGPAFGSSGLGGASRWWLHRSLENLAGDLERRGARLLLRRGEPGQVLEDLVAESGAGAVYWNRRYDPAGIASDKAAKAALQARGLTVQSFAAALLREPWEVKSGSGDPYKVFTPFWKALQALGEPPPPLPAPSSLQGALEPASDRLEDWGLLPVEPDWSGGLEAAWRPGEATAAERLEDFLEETLAAYPEARDRPDREGTSRLSPHLHWGEIGPRQVWHRTQELIRRQGGGAAEKGAWSFLRELAWRDFSHHLLFHWPSLPEVSWKEPFAAFPWREDAAGLDAWQRGETGYPLVDAGLRQLRQSGWMHNRVRMIAASFLVKDLLIHWQEGAAWFWDNLVDADLANNSASWQWVAGSGADASPYFRIFNPVTQSRRFDPRGDYLRRWIPELADLDDKAIHAPWEAGEAALAEARITLGETYPEPILDHGAARQRALEAYRQTKGEAGG